MADQCLLTMADQSLFKWARQDRNSDRGGHVDEERYLQIQTARYSVKMGKSMHEVQED